VLKRWARELQAQLLTLWFGQSHPDTPWLAKLAAAVVVGYVFSPIDLIPDVVPVIGYLDDLILVPLGIWLVLRLIPAPVLEAARQKADQWVARNARRPKNDLAATLVVLLWLALAYWAWTAWFESKKP